MSDDYLLKYFYIYGVSDKIKDILKLKEFNPKNIIKPKVLSSYSAEGKTELFEILTNKINDEEYLGHNIFPKQANFLSDITYYPDPLELPTLNITENPFNQYIYNVKTFDQRPEHFSHCFQYKFKLDEKSEDNISLYFTVLIFYENATNESDLYQEKTENETKFFTIFSYSKFYHCFIGKALILVSEKPIFSFMKEILEYIYNEYIDKKYTYFPIEPTIINCFDKINKINENNMDENSARIRKNLLYKEPLLEYCDFNISFFLQMFNLKDIGLMAEFYLCSKNIIIACSEVEYLFPIYYIFMTLFFPLNESGIERFYKLVVPHEMTLQLTLFGSIPTVQFIYTKEALSDDFLEKVAKIKQEEILVFQIDKDNNNSFKKIKKIVEFKENAFNVNSNLNEYETIIGKLSNINEELYYLSLLLTTDIKEMQDYYIKSKKSPTFFDSSFDYSIYDSLRNHFIGLFIKFFVSCLKPINFNLNENKIEIDLITPRKIENDENANELLNTLYTTSQSDLIYKNEIIKKGEFDIKKIKKIIILDYFLKISSNDKKRSYFEPQKASETLKTITNEEKDEILKELFKHKNILNKKRNIFYYLNKLNIYPLQNSKKNCSFVIGTAKKLLPHIKYYQELTKKDKTKDIEIISKKKALYYMIFYGEKFNLHFGQFVNKKNNYLYKKKDNNAIIQSYMELIGNTKMFEKYYKITLDEAQIFNDLYITRILVIDNRKQLAACAVGLFFSVYIINLMSELSSRNPKNEILLKIINKKIEKLFLLFKQTEGFYGKFDFLLTLLYEIISYNRYSKVNDKYIQLLINILRDKKILPPITVILMYNHENTLDFKYIKQNLEDNRNKIDNRFQCFNDNNDMLNTINVRDDNKIISWYSINNKKYDLHKEDLYEEIIIKNIKMNKHEHDYDIMKEDEIYGDYHCSKGCDNNFLSFAIEKREFGGIIEDFFLCNPRYIIRRILQNIVDKNSLFIYPYNEYNDDIYQIAMLDELYFKIGFFKGD